MTQLLFAISTIGLGVLLIILGYQLYGPKPPKKPMPDDKLNELQRGALKLLTEFEEGAKRNHAKIGPQGQKNLEKAKLEIRSEPDILKWSKITQNLLLNADEALFMEKVFRELAGNLSSFIKAEPPIDPPNKVH